MKVVVEGKRYDTSTATELCDISPRGYYRGDFRYEDTRLYVTAKGKFFVAGEGGPLSRWSQSFGQYGHTNGEGLRPIDDEEAREYLERAGEIDAIERYFTVEDA